MQEDVLAKIKLIAYERLICPLIWSKKLIQLLPSFLPHLFKCICQLNTCYLLSILKLEKAITSMSWKQNNIYGISNSRLQTRQQRLYWKQQRSVKNVNHLDRIPPIEIFFLNRLCSVWNMFIYLQCSQLVQIVLNTFDI